MRRLYMFEDISRHVTIIGLHIAISGELLMLTLFFCRAGKLTGCERLNLEQHRCNTRYKKNKLIFIVD
jgi:hypothetical protein